MSTSSEPSRKFLKIAVCIGLIASCTVLIHAIASDRSSAILNGLRNAAHVPLFATIALLVHTAVSKTRLPYLWTATTCLIIAAAAEFSQRFTGGETDWIDYLRDCFGIALAIAAIALYRSTSGTRFGYRLAVAALPLSLTLSPLLYWTSVYATRAGEFPCLAQYDKALFHPLYQTFSATPTPVQPDPDSITLSLRDKAFAGISIIDPVPDWRNYRQLVFMARAEPGSEGPLALRIHDAEHDYAFQDRFNQTFELGVDAQIFVVDLTDVVAAPAGRQMDLARITDVTFFRSAPKRGDIVSISAPCLR